MSPESCEGLIGKGLKLCWGSTNDHPEQRSWFANTSKQCEQQTEMQIQDSLQKIIQSRYHSSPIQCEHRTVSNIHFLQIFIKSTENSRQYISTMCKQQQAVLQVLKLLVSLQMLLFSALREPRRDHEQEN